MKTKVFEIIYADDVKKHLRHIDKKYWGSIKKKIIEQLSFLPNSETINRKPLMKPPIDNRWELRFGPDNRFRVFYKINLETVEVWILAIGEKIREKLYIGGKEVTL